MKYTELLSGQGYNTLNGIQYPAGFTKWLIEVAKSLQIEYDCFQDVLITSLNVQQYLCPESWLVYFMDGYNPRYAVVEDFKNK